MAEAAVKDTSMEEILASIRKIINSDNKPESRESSTASTPSAMVEEPAISPDHPAAASTELNTGSAAAPVTETKPAFEARSASPAAAPVAASVEASTPEPTTPEPDAAENAAPTPASLADLARELKVMDEPEAAATPEPVVEDVALWEDALKDAVGGAIENNISGETVTEAEDDTSLLTMELDTEVEVAAEPEFGEVVSEEFEAAETPVYKPAETVIDPVASPPAIDTEEIVAVSADTSAVVDSAEIEETPAVEPQAPLAEAAAAMVAPATENAVNASIRRLKESVEGNEAAHAEAVLRPMLKEWLDENLPELVERIVREEISRLVK